MKFVLGTVASVLASAGAAHAICQFDQGLGCVQIGADAGSLAGPIGAPNNCTTGYEITNSQQCASAGANVCCYQGYTTYGSMTFANTWQAGGGTAGAYQINGHCLIPNLVITGEGQTTTLAVNLLRGGTRSISGSPEHFWRVELRRPDGVLIGTWAEGFQFTDGELTPFSTPTFGDIPVGQPFNVIVSVQWGALCGGSSGSATGFLDFAANLFTTQEGYAINSAEGNVDDGWFVPNAPRCVGDADRSGHVSFSDITEVLAYWASEYGLGSGRGDSNGDGLVDFGDVTAILGNWLTPCCGNE